MEPNPPEAENEDSITEERSTGIPSSEGKWQPPPLASRHSSSLPSSPGEAKWSVPPAPTKRDSISPPNLRGQSGFPRIRIWHLLVLALLIAVAANWDKVPILWAEIFSRQPTDEWSRAMARTEMSTHFENGSLLEFKIDHITILRAESGIVQIMTTGLATLREALYSDASLDQAINEKTSGAGSLKAARERADLVRQRKNLSIMEPEPTEPHLVRQTSPVGKSVPFQFEFQAHREALRWQKDKVLNASVSPADAFEGKPLNSFPRNAATIGTSEAAQQVSDFISQTQRYVSAVEEAQRTAEQATPVTVPVPASEARPTSPVISTDRAEQISSPLSSTDITGLLNAWLTALNSANIQELATLYSDPVDYYDEGLLTRERLITSIAFYLSRWPVQRPSLASQPTWSQSNGTDYQVVFAYNFDARNPATSKRSRGTAQIVWLVRRKIDDGKLVIVSARERILRRLKQ